jgi:hypothetical protein
MKVKFEVELDTDKQSDLEKVEEMISWLQEIAEMLRSD